MRVVDVAAVLGINASIDQRKSTPQTKSSESLRRKNMLLLRCGKARRERSKMTRFLAMSEGKGAEIRRRTGYKKIIDTCRQAQKDGLDWVWVNTCCVDKKGSFELYKKIVDTYRVNKESSADSRNIPPRHNLGVLATKRVEAHPKAVFTGMDAARAHRTQGCLLL